MKTLQTSAIAMILGLFITTSMQAQYNTINIADHQSGSSADVFYVKPPQQTDQKTFDISLYRVQQSMTVCLSVAKDAGQKVVVRLLDTKGDEVYRELLGRHTDKYARRFDLSSLTDGSYTIEVRNGSEVMHRVVNLSTAKPIESSDRTIIALN